MPMYMRNAKPATILCLTMGFALLNADSANAALPDNTIYERQQIIQQKQQQLTSKRVQENLQRQVNQKMTKPSQQPNRLEVFSLPKETNSFKINHFYLEPSPFSSKFKWINR